MPPLSHDGGGGDPQKATGPNAYEQEREARIAANRARLVALGIVSSANSSATMPLGVLSSSSGRPSAWARSAFGASDKATKRRRTVSMKSFTRAEPTRSSSRIRSLEAEGKSVRPGMRDLEQQQQQQQSPKRRRRGANVRGGGGREEQRRPDHASCPAAVPTTYAAPFSLRSIDVTVLCLGRVHRGAWRHRYWSSAGCLFHHAYPVGFRSVKSAVFGRSWECRVEEGEAGPLFVVESVVDDDAGEGGGEGGGSGRARAAGNSSHGPLGPRRFEGPSPTRPWTAACLAAATGQRISGPLFFGFSDPATQAAVESLYSPRELEAARRGEGGKRMQEEGEEGEGEEEGEGVEGGQGGEGSGGSGPRSSSAAASASAAAAAAAAAATERAALDFVARYGIGEAAACVLAHTKALQGERFASADELEAWARGGSGGAGGEGGGGGGGERGLPPRARRLLDFLLESEEFPASTRRWPAWRLRMAPRLVAAVCGLGERRGEEEQGAGGEEKEEGKREAEEGAGASAARSRRTRATRSSRK